ncbi:MAG: DUF2399 domain-containing protein [Nitrososphaeraceae archaeon]|nr:DUF2399 domain-containing protein [Nitrososphaeraceae archaeon]
MQNSIYYYKPADFKQYVRTIVDMSITVSGALDTFREVKYLPRKFKEMTVKELSNSPKLMQVLYDALRQGMQPESKFKLLYKKKVRETQLIRSIGKKYNVDTDRLRAKVVTGCYSDGYQTIPYALEVVIAPRTDIGVDHAGEVKFIGNINNTPSIDGGEEYFSGGEYAWRDRKGNALTASSIMGILSECGFNTSDYYSRRRKACVVFVNLLTPVPDWLGGAGKTKIDLRPYAKVIAETVSRFAYKMPSYHGEGIKTTWTDDWSEDDDNGGGKKGEYKEYLRDFLRDRRRAIEADPSLRIRDRLTQSGVWYRMRPKMIEGRFKPRNKSTNSKGQIIYDWGTTREGLTNKIRKTIEELWPAEGITREYLGIVAKARAMMYFNDQVYPVSFDSKEELANTKTTDLIIVEKEGITDVLLDAAKRYRIALVATAGQFTDYVQDLMRLAVEAGLNVCILTDYDIHGINIWRNAYVRINRLGIDRDTIKWLKENGYPNLREKDVEEEYSPNPKLFEAGDDPYLLTKRIELDSIVEKVGADALWKYLVYRLGVEFPEARDYRNVVPEPEPEDYYTDEVNEFLDYIRNYIRGSYNDEWTEIKDHELAKVDGLLEVEKQKQKDDEILKPIVQNDEGVKLIASKLRELMESEKLPEPNLSTEFKSDQDQNNQKND